MVTDSCFFTYLYGSKYVKKFIEDSVLLIMYTPDENAMYKFYISFDSQHFLLAVYFTACKKRCKQYNI